MKHLKFASYLLLAVAFLTSCEEEIMIISDTAETTTKESLMTPPGFGNLNFFYKANDFDCNNLTTQNFGAAYDDDHWFPSPLDATSDNMVFSPGDMLPGISFESNYGFVIDDSYQEWPNVLMTGYYFTKSEDYTPNNITVHFTSNTVYDVSMMLYGNNYAFVTFFGADENYLGATPFLVGYQGSYLAVRSLEEPIAKIVIELDYAKGNTSYYPVGIGSISFGECNDYDGDGCFNEDDAYPHSNLAETLSIGENNYYDIDNVKVDCGTFMQDQIDDLINQINDSYYYNKSDSDYEDNWEELHDAFTTKLAHITYYWRINKLITAGERAEISSDAWSADIPYSDVE